MIFFSLGFEGLKMGQRSIFLLFFGFNYVVGWTNYCLG